MLAFSENIENVIIDKFDSAKESIIIVVAWFTSPMIINSLIDIKRYKNIEIEILVDDNFTNEKYFFERFSAILYKEGIKVRKQKFKGFNHNKFSIIDNQKIIIGSYNYTKRASKNKETIVILESKEIASYFTRIFKFFTVDNYIDQNIEILFENFEFANRIISTYYPFNKKTLNKIKDKIEIGACYTYPNGIYDEIYYRPGLIFNPKYIHHNELKNQKKYKISMKDIDSNFSQEFSLPVKKETIINFQTNEINNFNLSILNEYSLYHEVDIDYDQYSDDALKNEIAIKLFYKRKFEQTFSKSELEKIINDNIDLIKEDYIWANNFMPFLNDRIILDLYN
ncbi:phospholipase D-like domain-containing protein [Gillisia hiemivivida]|uniref:phospholipase D n=1 Tax=Gillisia hiemivivida TaxID=291190 RepID=A0A5C6ZY66_9FLAO|nr:phospholipase D-like domain-containing protein [Gillisia hiemivivida]TXD95668.1 DUF1669 domain-containing protein [Gillisia hiemivivida]